MAHRSLVGLVCAAALVCLLSRQCSALEDENSYSAGSNSREIENLDAGEINTAGSGARDVDAGERPQLSSKLGNMEEEISAIQRELNKRRLTTGDVETQLHSASSLAPKERFAKLLSVLTGQLGAVNHLLKGDQSPRADSKKGGNGNGTGNDLAERSRDRDVDAERSRDSDNSSRQAAADELTSLKDRVLNGGTVSEAQMQAAMRALRGFGKDATHRRYRHSKGADNDGIGAYGNAAGGGTASMDELNEQVHNDMDAAVDLASQLKQVVTSLKIKEIEVRAVKKKMALEMDQITNGGGAEIAEQLTADVAKRGEREREARELVAQIAKIKAEVASSSKRLKEDKQKIQDM